MAGAIFRRLISAEIRPSGSCLRDLVYPASLSRYGRLQSTDCPSLCLRVSSTGNSMKPLGGLVPRLTRTNVSICRRVIIAHGSDECCEAIFPRPHCREEKELRLFASDVALTRGPFFHCDLASLAHFADWRLKGHSHDRCFCRRQSKWVETWWFYNDPIFR